MRRATLALLAATALLSGCGGSSQAETPTATVTTTAVDPKVYADEITEVFRATYELDKAAESDAEREAVTADWAAFVATVDGLEPPDGGDSAHNRMVAAFEAYVEARQETTAVCNETPGPGGPCSVAARTEGDRWTAAINRAEEIPGLSALVT